MPRKLSDTRIRIMRRLASRNLDRDGAETAAEIGIGVGVPVLGSGQTTNVLRGLANIGLAAKLGISPAANARTWTITNAGRAALHDADEEARLVKLEEG